MDDVRTPSLNTRCTQIGVWKQHTFLSPLPLLPTTFMHTDNQFVLPVLFSPHSNWLSDSGERDLMTLSSSCTTPNSADDQHGLSDLPSNNDAR